MNTIQRTSMNTADVKQYDSLFDRYMTGELGGQIKSPECAEVSALLDSMIEANTPADVADEMIEKLSDFALACTHDGFVGGLRIGIRIGLAAMGRMRG